MRLFAFLPATLRRLLTTDPSRLQRPIFMEGATMFADISGFTPLSEALTRMGREGSEHLTRTLNTYFSAIIAAVEGGGGDVMRFAGDAVTAYFPDPDGGARAIRAALAIQRHMAAHPEASSPVGSFPIRIKIGIASGTHVVMAVGKENAQDYIFAGAPVDGAAEAEHHAAAGDIVLAAAYSVKRTAYSVKQIKEGFWRILGFQPSAFSLQHESQENTQAEACGYIPPSQPETSPQVADPPADEACEPFLHPIVSQKARSGYAGLLNEHRKAAVLFVSFGSSGDYADEKTWDAVNAFYGEARGLVDAHEGCLNKVDMGDKGSKFLITFGAPLAHEDDPDRAVHLARELMAVAKANEIPIAIGINSGTIFAGIVGNDDRCEYTVMGDAVNLSARLMQAARGEGILVSGPVAQGAKSFSFKALPPIAVKGKAELIPIFLPVPKKEEGQGERRLFVGKKQELDQAVRFLSAKPGEPKLLAITGEAGMGKTAFLFAGLKAFENRPILYIACQSYTSLFPYHAWKRALKEALEKLPGPPGEGEKWKHLLESRAPELLPFASLLLDFLEIGHDLKAVPADEQTKKSVLEKEIALLLNGLAADGSCFLVLDNFQWMDEAGRELFSRLLRALAGPAPALIVGMREAYPDVAEVLPFLSIPIGPLDASEASDLIKHSVGTERVPERLTQTASEASHGRPLLILETLKTYFDSGYASRDQAHPDILLLDETKKPTIPATLEALVMSRFDHLPAGEQYLLKVFSVIGDAIPADLASRVLSVIGAGEGALPALLERKDFLTLSEDGGQYLFAQSHVRSTLYDSLDYALRRDLHGKAAESYRAILPESHPERDQLLAFHYLEARKIAEGMAFILKAADKAYETYAFPSALRLYQALLGEKGALPPALLAHAAVRAGDSLIKIGHFQEALELLSESLIQAVPAGDARSGLYKLAADGHRLTGNFTSAERCLAQAEAQASSDLQKFQILVTRGTLWAQMSRFKEALGLFDELMSNYRGKVPVEEMERTATVRGPLLFVTGKRDEALALLKKAKRQFLKRNEIFSATRILNNLGSFFSASGMSDKSFHIFLESKKYQESFGIQQFLITTLNEIGCESMLLGKWKNAYYHFQYALSMCAKYSDPYEVKIACDLNELYQYLAIYKLCRKCLTRASILAHSKHFMYSNVLFYWVEYLCNLPYPRCLPRFLGKFKSEIEKQHAHYFRELYWAYSAYALFLNHKDKDANLLALEVYGRAIKGGLKKELFLALKTLSLTSQRAEKEKYIIELMQTAEEMKLNQFRMEAILISLEWGFDGDLIKKGDALLRQTPFCNLAWKYHSLAGEYYLKNGKKDLARKRVSKASAFYGHILENLPWSKIRGYFENQDEAIRLKNLSAQFKAVSPAELPKIYKEIG